MLTFNIAFRSDEPMSISGLRMADLFLCTCDQQPILPPVKIDRDALTGNYVREANVLQEPGGLRLVRSQSGDDGALMLLEVNPDREKIVDHPYSYCNGEVPPDPQFSRRAYDLFQLQPGQEVMVKAKRQVGPLVTIHHIGWNGKDLVLSQSAPRDDMVFVGTDRLQILPRELQEIEAIISDRTGSAEQLLAGVEKLKAVQSKCLTAGLGLGFARHALALGKSLERIGCVAEATAVTKLALAPLYAVPGDSSTELDSLRREVTVELQRMRLLCPPQTDSRGVSAK